jgi:hypothetical protein
LTLGTNQMNKIIADFNVSAITHPAPEAV